jgi:MiaB/RimO family radical SAM methylthiotransferase
MAVKMPVPAPKRIIKGRMKVFICQCGCGLRGLDGARLENYFRLNGGSVIEDPQKADIIVLIACGYKKSREDECFRLIREFHKLRGKLLVVGCLPEISPTRFKRAFHGPALPSKNLDHIETFFPSFKIKYRDVPDANRPMPQFRMRNGQEGAQPPVIRIANGCLGQCAYCAIRQAVGTLRSKPIDICVKEYRALLEKGHTCFILNAEDVGSYGFDIGSSFPELLDHLERVDRRPNIYWKLLAFNPHNLIRYQGELLKYVRKGRIIDLQSDIQSGSQRILKLMNRPYKIAEVTKGLLNLKKANPNIYLRTICLVGFPSETDEEYMDSLSVMKKIDLDYILVIPYSDRERTPSSRMPHKIPAATIEKRLEMARKYFSRENFTASRDIHFLTLMKSAPPYEPDPFVWRIRCQA